MSRARITILCGLALAVTISGCGQNTAEKKDGEQAAIAVQMTKDDFKKKLAATAYPSYPGEAGTLQGAALVEKGLLELVGASSLQAKAADGKPGYYALVFRCTDGNVRMKFFPFAINNSKVLSVMEIREE